MGEISIVHGIIIVRDVDNFKNVVRSMEPDENYPWIRAEMFSLSSEERPYFYEAPVATFGATYKNLDGGIELSEFILKYEYLLSRISFDFSRLKLETGFYGNFEFFWGSKRGVEREFYNNGELWETENWFFGLGPRDMFGSIGEQILREPIDFKYPIEFDPTIKEEFNAIIPELNRITLYRRVYLNTWKNSNVFSGRAHLILTYLKLKKVVRFGWDRGKGLFIERLGEIQKLDTPYH